jgi:6-phosphogluconolactonase (cycloisomerase 2 family)
LPLQQDGSIGEIKQLIAHKGSSIVEKDKVNHMHILVFLHTMKSI